MNKSISFLLALVLVGVTALAQEREKRPNVLLIGVDDLNDWIGCLGGHPQAKTPNIDRLSGRCTVQFLRDSFSTAK